MLSETRAELDDFHQASKELEAELESELQRTEKAQQELQTKVVRADHERDEWKVSLRYPLAISPDGSADQIYVPPDNTQHNDDFFAARIGPTQARTSTNQSASSRT